MANDKKNREFKLASGVLCFNCGNQMPVASTFAGVAETIGCTTTDCHQWGKRYEVPKITLRRIVED